LTKLRERGKERYGVALVLILSSMIFVMASPDEGWAEVTALSLQGAALFASLRAAQPDIRLRVASGVIIGLSLAVSINLALFDVDEGTAFVKWASLLLVLTASPVIAFGLIRQVKERRAITIHTMLGVLCIYLLMAIAFASAFGLIHEVSNNPFFRHGDGADTLSNYLYFSLTTITTAGLGDFAPAQGLGRSLTAAEALIGQIYLVTVVAVIVGNLGRKR
jgi:hypothetical protein